MVAKSACGVSSMSMHCMLCRASSLYEYEYEYYLTSTSYMYS